MQRVIPLGVTAEELFQGELARLLPYHRMYGKQYCLPSATLYAHLEYEKLKTASVLVDRIYWKALRFTQRFLPDEFLKERLGIHPSLVDTARIETPAHGLSRQDWIIGEDGMKCIENNTDTPTGVPEAAYLGNLVAGRYTPYRSATAGLREVMLAAFGHLIDHYREAGLGGMIACSSYDWHLEDKCNTEYVLDVIRELGYEASFVPLGQLEIIPGDGLYGGGKRIDILYRLYPLEYLIHDKDAVSGMPVGEALIELVAEGKLGLINPPQSAITQSKGFMALIWALYERNELSADVLGHPLFDAGELEAIRTYLLPTYFENTVFLQEQVPFVAKGYWGREGKGTALYGADGMLEQDEWGNQEDADEAEDTKHYYNSQPKVYQKRVPMEKTSVHTEAGLYDGYLLTGAYVIGGHFAGLLPRIGGIITGDMAYFCAAVVQQDE